MACLAKWFGVCLRIKWLWVRAVLQSLSGKVIEWKTSIKFLGILHDEHLSWKNHISVVENKVSKNIGILRQGKNIFSKGGLKPLYFSFVHSYVNHGNITWGSTT